MRALNKFESCIKYDDESHEWPQVIAILIACLGSLTFGALFSWPSPSIPILLSNTSYVNSVTVEETSYFAVIPPITSALTSPIIAFLVDRIGRKKTVLLIALPQLLSWILIYFADKIYLIYLSRAFSGIGEATLFGVLPTYVGEISVPSVRGRWGNSISIFIYIGQLAINTVGAFCSIKTTALIFCTIPILHILTMTLVPESPYFLLMKNRHEEARSALQKLRWKKNVTRELSDLAKDVDRQISESGTFRDLFTIPVNRKALLISIALRGAQQLSGLAAFAVYTQQLFKKTEGLSAAQSAIIFCTVLVISITCFASIVDRFGRKPMMIFSCGGCFIILMIEATYFYIAQKRTDIDVSCIKWIPLAGMVCFIIVCSSGLGIVPTLMLSELFSASIKAKAMCVLNICFAIYVLSISKMFHSLTHYFGIYVPFYLFSICCFISLLFSYYFLPETKGKTLEEIQQNLRGHTCDKEIEITKC